MIIYHYWNLSPVLYNPDKSHLKPSTRTKTETETRLLYSFMSYKTISCYSSCNPGKDNQKRLDAYFILVFTSPSSHLCIMCCFVNSCDVSSWSFTAAISVLKQDVISEESMCLRNLETFSYFNEMIIDKMNMFRLEISIWHNLSTSKHTDVIGKCSLLHSVSVN